MLQKEASEWRPVACLNQERLLGGGENVLGTLDGGMPCSKACRSMRQSSTSVGGILTGCWEGLVGVEDVGLHRACWGALKA